MDGVNSLPREADFPSVEAEDELAEVVAEMLFADGS
jgi:hypothetical protein